MGLFLERQHRDVHNSRMTPHLADPASHFGTARFDPEAFAAALAEAGSGRPQALRHAALSNRGLLLLSPAAASGEVAALTGWGAAHQPHLRQLFLATRPDPRRAMQQLAQRGSFRSCHDFLVPSSYG